MELVNMQNYLHDLFLLLKKAINFQWFHKGANSVIFGVFLFLR